jgi:hypothetical protein
MGAVVPVTLKPVPFTTTWLTVTGVVPVLITETGTVFDVPTFVLTDNVAGATDSAGSGSAIPAQPAIQATPRARRLDSTRTRFSLNTFMSIRSPYDKFRFFLSIHRFAVPEGRGDIRQSHRRFGTHYRQGLWSSDLGRVCNSISYWYGPCTFTCTKGQYGFFGILNR